MRALDVEIYNRFFVGLAILQLRSDELLALLVLIGKVSDWFPEKELSGMAWLCTFSFAAVVIKPCREGIRCKHGVSDQNSRL